MDSMEVPLLIIIVPPPEDSESVVTVRDGNEGSRKKQKRPSLRSSKDYSAPAGSNVFIPCLHNTKTYKCCKIRPADAIRFRNSLFGKDIKQYQDEYVSRYIRHRDIRRQRPRPSVGTGSKIKIKSFWFIYKKFGFAY
uniref:Uncharacterized protein n=1 Tax=Cacopsylla melanoneura TaxID=428564 RepID=A0A8D8U0B0_9HEMI